MADLATHQDPKEDLWIAIRDKDSEVHNVDYMSKFSHPGGQENFKKLGTTDPESITEEWSTGPSSPETAIASQATRIRTPVASMRTKALAEDLLGDYVPLNEKANGERKDDMQKEGIEKTREEDGDDEGYRRKKRNEKAVGKANKGAKRAKKQKPAAWDARASELHTHRGNITDEAVRRSKRLRKRREVIVVKEKEELVVSRDIRQGDRAIDI